MNRREMLLASGAFGLMTRPGILSANPTSGYFVPPEEGPHQRTFMQWPANRRVHSDRVFRKMAQQTIADIANAISDFEPVTLLAAKEDHSSARKKLSASVELWDIPTDDLWCRDSGPIFVVNENGDLAITNIQFNGWGERQINTNDSQIARRVSEHLGLPFLKSGLIGEGGGVEQDGHGLLMAHESSWVHDNRNPGMSRNEIEALLLKAYGADRMIWSAGVWDEDITDYHIDSLARFTGPGRVLINLPDDPDPADPFHMAALDTHDVLVAAGLQVDVIPEPVERRIDDEEFVASYANYYVCNGAVIVAEFGDRETDQIAQDAISRHYPGREIITLNVDTLGEMGGGIHCATQQMPAVT
ncbi:agmatine deiminase family protein [Ruegeria arenilitoris]|uniref:agmatine deiminase family protein n=1 Tax=Ruegeria arenilitoris TaxID=1173585 RepID=UPI00147FC52E|nr:agmatine deiminase family protein [Ruegeria arenilitoris]